MKIFAYLESEQFTVWPDSCMLISNRPLYIPDFESAFYALPMLALKVSKLGKCVAERFSGRYMREYSMGLLILPESALQKIRDGRMIDAGELCFDNAVVAGDWQKIEGETSEFPAGIPEIFNLEIERGGELERSQPGVDSRKAPEALSRFSARNTIKMGDLLMLPIGGEPIRLERNLTLKGFVRGNVCGENADAEQKLKNTEGADRIEILHTRFK